MNRKIFALVAIQVFVLLFMAGSQWMIAAFGEEVRLKTAPVDPRDVFYGDYVILNYDISEIDIRYFRDGETPEQGDTVYAVLKREGDYDQLVSAHLQKPTIAADEQVLKGRIQYVMKNWNREREREDTIRSVRVQYGIERYYVPEGTGLELENKRGQFDVIVKVSSWGQSVSELSFIAVDIITQQEANERVTEYLREQSLSAYPVRSELLARNEHQDRPVWVVEVEFFLDRKAPTESMTIIVDAKNGNILSER